MSEPWMLLVAHSPLRVSTTKYGTAANARLDCRYAETALRVPGELFKNG